MCIRDRCNPPPIFYSYFSFFIRPILPANRRKEQRKVFLFQLLSLIHIFRPEIEASKLNVEASELGINIAKSSYFPTISLSAGIGTNHTSGLCYTGRR